MKYKYKAITTLVKMDEITAKEISEYINSWIEVYITDWRNINE